MHNISRNITEKAMYKLVAAFALVASTLVSIPSSQADDISTRIARQQGKIAKMQGKKKISAGTANRADSFTYRISEQEQKMKDRHQGRLTRRDRARLNRELNRNNNMINKSSK